MRHIGFEYNFFAIGQGLFSAGFLRDETCRIRFCWIFDCGTMSKNDYLHREINYLKTYCIEDKERIELFCLSHFDEDHIKGARQLLSEHPVDTLVMPYIPLIQRMQIALDAADVSNEYLQFLIDPAGYMSDVAGNNLTQIVFIMGSTPSSEEQRITLPPGEPSNDNWGLDFPDSKRPEPPSNEEVYGTEETPHNVKRLYFLDDSKPFTVAGAWEFYFYNEYIPEDKQSTLRQNVIQIIKKHKEPTNVFNGELLLKELKDSYRRHFGTSNTAQNRISLTLYTGPARIGKRIERMCYGLLPVHYNSTSMLLRAYTNGRVDYRVSLCYFGDYPLTKVEKIRPIKNHYGLERWEDIDIIQVPHHGAKTTWYPGASIEFRHSISIISSGLAFKRHPTSMVLDDLKSHGTTLVNELQRAVFAGYVRFK